MALVSFSVCEGAGRNGARCYAQYDIITVQVTYREVNWRAASRFTSRPLPQHAAVQQGPVANIAPRRAEHSALHEIYEITFLNHSV